MSTPPAPLHDELADRSFSFYPPILGVAHNEWRLVEATWSDILVRNTKSGLEAAIPRKLVGAVAQVEEPVMIVGLTRELEYRTGSVWPTGRKIRTMPSPPLKAVLLMPKPEGGLEEGPRGLQAMMGSGPGEGAEVKIAKMIGFAFASLAVIGLLAWAIVKFTPDARPTYVGKDQSYLELSREDDYHAVLRRLGTPREDRWREESGELQFRALGYPERGFIVILMGTGRDSARYIGAVVPSRDGKRWSAAHGVESARGSSTLSLLRGLKPF